MKVLNYNTVVRFKTLKYGIIEGEIYYHEKINNTWHYWVNIDLERFKHVNPSSINNVVIIEQVLNINTIKDSDWVDESQI